MAQLYLIAQAFCLFGRVYVWQNFIVDWPFPEQPILDSSKLEESADDNFKFDENGRRQIKCCLRYSYPEDRIFNRVISDISIVVRETTLTISDSPKTVSPIKSEIVRVVSLSTKKITEIKKKKTDPQGLDTLNDGICLQQRRKQRGKKWKIQITSISPFTGTGFRRVVKALHYMLDSYESNKILNYHFIRSYRVWGGFNHLSSKTL